MHQLQRKDKREFRETAENSQGHMDFIGCVSYAGAIFFLVATICSLFLQNGFEMLNAKQELEDLKINSEYNYCTYC